MPLQNHNRATHVEFRETTDKLVKSMPGVMSPSFLCRLCGEQKRTEGRKQYIKGNTRSGWICAACAK